jgi:hypothetical protein
MIDVYRRDEPDLPTRASAIRRLAIVGLKAIKYAKPGYQPSSRPDAHADKRQIAAWEDREKQPIEFGGRKKLPLSGKALMGNE